MGTAQSVEEPRLYSGADWISNIYERKNSKAKRGQQIPPFPCGQFFQVHGSKLKLHPVRHLSQASVLRITHRVFFLGVCEDPFNAFFASLVKLPVCRRTCKMPETAVVSGIFSFLLPKAGHIDNSTKCDIISPSEKI